MASKFDFRSLNKYVSAKAADDLNRFLEKMPQNAGSTVLTVAGIAWFAVAALGLVAMLQTQKVTELKATLEASETLKPIVPVMAMTPVGTDEVKDFVDKAKNLYSGLVITSNGNILTVQSRSTASFAQFREIMGHVVSGGANWKVSVNSMCIGRECPQNAMEAVLRIEKVNISKPAAETSSPAGKSES